MKLLTSHMLTKYNENGFASIKQSLIKVCNPTIVYYNLVSNTCSSKLLTFPAFKFLLTSYALNVPLTNFGVESFISNGRFDEIKFCQHLLDL